MFKTRFISMLVLLMTAVTGAWAQEQSETIVTTDYIVEGTHFTISNNDHYADSDGMNADGGITVTSKNGETITKVVISCTWDPGSVNDGNTSVSSGTKEITNGGGTITVTGVNASTFTFTCSSDKFPQFGQFVVYYTEAPATVAVTGVTLAPTSATLTLGETETVTLIPTVLPDDATDKSVTWSSSNEAVATVADGVVTAVAAGEATITVTTTDGAKTATCAVTVAAPAASTYTVTLKEGTEDATSWTITPAEATTTGVAAGTEVKATYGGAKKVKSVKAVKKAKPAATVTTAPSAKTGVKAGEDVAIVNEGTAEGGTMMYMVNATQPASTDGFSATVPTAEGLTAGTYYVWYYVKADDSHTDSEISASGIEVTIAAAEITVTWNSFPTGVNSFSQDGVTLTADYIGWGIIEANNKGGTFTTTLGNFTKIEITASVFHMSGEGWTVSGNKATWTGNASTVTFRFSSNDDEDSATEGLSSMVFTIQPN